MACLSIIRHIQALEGINWTPFLYMKRIVLEWFLDCTVSIQSADSKLPASEIPKNWINEQQFRLFIGNHILTLTILDVPTIRMENAISVPARDMEIHLKYSTPPPSHEVILKSLGYKVEALPNNNGDESDLIGKFLRYFADLLEVFGKLIIPLGENRPVTSRRRYSSCEDDDELNDEDETDESE